MRPFAKSVKGLVFGICSEIGAPVDENLLADRAAVGFILWLVEDEDSVGKPASAYRAGSGFAKPGFETGLADDMGAREADWCWDDARN